MQAQPVHASELPLVKNQANVAVTITRYETPTLYPVDVSVCQEDHQWYVIATSPEGNVLAQKYVGCDTQPMQQVEDTQVPAPIPTPPVCTPFGADPRC